MPNITRFFPSEYGTDIEYGPQSVNEKPHQLKLKVRAYIKENIKRLEYTYVVTGPYSDMFLDVVGGDPRGGQFDLKDKKAVLVGSGDNPISLTSMKEYAHHLPLSSKRHANHGCRSTGRLVVASMLHPKESRNKALKVNSFTATPHQILAEFERQTGGQKWQVSYTPLEEIKAIEKEMWDQGTPAAVGYTLRRIWAEGGTLYDKRDNEAIGCSDTDTLQVVVERWINVQEGKPAGKL